MPLTLPVPPTLVTVPVFVVQPESLLNALSLISLAALRDSVVPFCRINSVVPEISPVISVSSLKSKLSVTVPDVPPPLKPVPAVTPSMSPASLVKLITPVAAL